MAHRARKRFGQHFLHDGGIIGDIVGAIAPQSGDTLVEIGPGLGAITAPLARLGVKLHAIEFDRDLAAKLRQQYADNDQVEIHEADALKFDFRALGNDLRVVGNLPYNISTPLLFHLIEQRGCIRDMHFMLQKEVVRRMAAEPGGRDFGRLTVMLGCFMQVAELFDVPPTAFDPPPKVMSAIVRLAPQPEGRFCINDQSVLAKLVAQAFSQRRKTLRNSLRQVADITLLESVGIDPGARPEQIPVAAWVALANALDES